MSFLAGRRRWARRGAALCLLLALLPAVEGARAEGRRTLWVSVAMSLLPAMQETADLFEARHPGVEVALNAGASGVLLQQMLRGAPTDLFVSASPAEPDRLADEGLLREGTRRTIATNRIVILVPASSEPPASVGRLTEPRYDRIAMGNPRTAPVGRYAERGLELAGLLQTLRPRLVLAENARQVLEYLARGEVAAGLLYRSDARILADRVAVGPELPADPAAPILYQAVVLADARNPALALEFRELIGSPEGQAILQRHGFLRAPAPLPPRR